MNDKRAHLLKILPGSRSYGKTVAELADELNITPERAAYLLGTLRGDVSDDGAPMFRDKRWRRARAPKVRIYRRTLPAPTKT